MSRWSLVPLLGCFVGCGGSQSPGSDAGDADAPPLDQGIASDAAIDAARPSFEVVPDRGGLVPDDGGLILDDGGSIVRHDASPMFDEATLVASPTTYSFPSTMIGEMSAAARFVVSNIGFASSGPISHVIDGSTEFAVNASTCGQPLGYLGTCEVAVIFRPISGGHKSARLTISATPGKTFTVLLSGNSMQAGSVRLDPTVYDFFPAVVIPTPGDPQQPMYPVSTPFAVTNNGGSIVGPISAVIEGHDAADFSIASNTCATLAPGASCTMTVRFKPTTPGPRTTNLTVSVPGLTMLSATLSGIGAEAAKLTLSPLSQNFGHIPIGMKSAFSFNVTNTGGVDTGKISFSLEGQNISEFMVMPDASCLDALKPSFTCSITVTFAPILVGTKSASLRVSASPGGLLKADLTATAITSTGQLSLTSPSPDPFGTVVVGDSSTGFFVVENKGTTPTGKITAALSGSNANEFVVTDNSCPDPLPPAQQCGITVRFTPQLSGQRTANLQVTAPPNAFASLIIRGLAAAPAQLLISPTTRNFGNRTVGSQTGSIQEFTVRLSGSMTTGPVSVAPEGPDGPNFQVVYNDCQNTTLSASRTSCRVGVRFVPVSTGQKTASLTASATPGGVVRATLYGNGT